MTDNSAKITRLIRLGPIFGHSCLPDTSAGVFDVIKMRYSVTAIYDRHDLALTAIRAPGANIDFVYLSRCLSHVRFLDRRCPPKNLAAYVAVPPLSHLLIRMSPEFKCGKLRPIPNHGAGLGTRYPVCERAKHKVAEAIPRLK